MKKILISLLLAAILNLTVGCYSYKMVTVSEYKKIEMEDKPDDIRIMTKDYQLYQFSNSNFYIKNDTLYGKIKKPSDSKDELIEKKIAVADIADVELKSFDWVKTILLSLGIYLGIGLIIGISIGLNKRIGS